MTLTAADLHPYQRTASDWLVERQGAALWLDMGLGKTGATIDAMSRLFSSFETGRALVIAPKRVALRTWPAELRLWEQAADLPFAVLGEGSKVGADVAHKFAHDPAPVHIISRDNVAALVKLAKAAKRWPYDLVVIDESSSFKSASSKRFRALRSMLGSLSRVIELTGTPAPNGYMDLWPQIYLIDKGERLGKTLTAYRQRWFTGHPIGHTRGMIWNLRKGAKAEIDARLADICLSMSAEEYLTLPPVIENRIRIGLTRNERRQYRELEREFLLELAGDTVAAFSAATLSGKLRQFCNGALYLEDGAWSQVHTAKLDALESVLAEAGGPVLCGYQFRSDVARIKERFPFARTVDEEGALDAWERGEVALLLAHPASAGHGLNLQAGGNVLVWFGLPWSLEEFQQFGKRLHRQGQTKPVFVHYLIADGTIDERLVATLSVKGQTQASLLEAVKADAERRAA